MEDNNIVEAEMLTPPAPQKHPEARTMSFIDAIKAIMDGKKVRRVSWPTETDHCLLRNEWLTIHTKGDFHSWTVSEGDMEGNDYVFTEGVEK